MGECCVGNSDAQLTSAQQGIDICRLVVWLGWLICTIWLKGMPFSQLMDSSLSCKLEMKELNALEM